MNACIISLFVVLRCGVCVFALWPNVGTVLFTSQDLNKNTWNKSNMALLLARRQFQLLIPPPDAVTLNKDYVDKILDYFKGIYATIKQESLGDAEIEQILTAAASDVIGGYLRSFVLPVTKLYFYGGTISFDDMNKIQSFYNELKQYLRTKGEGWRDPARNVINSIILKTARLPRQNLKRNCKHFKNPCNSFVYLLRENPGNFNEDEITIPLPVINWEDNTIFMPVVNDTTFSLCSPKHNNSLKEYYDKAVCCAKNIGQQTEDKFNRRFQTWVSADVAPHLSDDGVYAALGNVLSLLNTTKTLCDVILNAYDQKTQIQYFSTQNLTRSKGVKLFHKLLGASSKKKSIIVAVILFLELIWCLLACRQIFFKKPSHSDRFTNVDILERGEFEVARSKDKYKKSFFSSLLEKDPFGFRKNSDEYARKQRNVEKLTESIFSGGDIHLVGMQLRSKPTSTLKHSGVISQVQSRSRQSQTTLPAKSNHGVSTKKLRPVSNTAINTYQCEVPVISKIRSKSLSVHAPPPPMEMNYEPTYEPTSQVISSKTVRRRDSRKTCETIISCDEYSDSVYNMSLAPIQSSSHTEYAVITRSQKNFQSTTLAGDNVQLRQKKSAVQFEIISQSERRASVVPPTAPSRAASYPTSCSELVTIEPKDPVVKIIPYPLSILPTTEPADPDENEINDESMLMCLDAHTETSVGKARTFLKKHCFVNKNSSRRTHKKYIEIQIERPQNANINLGVSEVFSPKETYQSPRKRLVSKIPQRASKLPELIVDETPELVRSGFDERSDTDESSSYVEKPQKKSRIARLCKRMPGTSADNSIRESKIPKLSFKERSHGHGILKFCRNRIRKNESPRQKLLQRDRSPEVFPKINEDSENSYESSPAVKRKQLKLRFRKPKAADDTEVKTDNSTLRYSRLNKTL